jgi:type I restriction enzyme S subunit
MMNNKQLTELGEEVSGVSAVPKGWAGVPMSEVASWGSGGTPSRSNSEYYGGTIPWIKTGELGGRFVFDTEEKITEVGLKNSSAKLFEKGSVAIAMYGAIIGKTSILAIDATTNQACGVGKPIEGITTSEYLYHYLSSQKEAFIEAGKGGAQPNISQTVIKNWQIPLAPFPEQNRIADKLDATLARVDACRERLARITPLLKRFRQSVLAAATSGQLTADWREEQNGFAAACKADYASSAAADQESAGASSPCSTGPIGITADLPSGITDESGNLQNGDCANKETPISAALHERLASQAQTNLLAMDAPNIEDAEPQNFSCFSLEALSTLGRVSGGLTKNAKRNDFPLQRPYLRVANVYANELRLDDVSEIGLTEAEFTKTRLEVGDLLIVEGNGSVEQIGRVAMWNDEILNCSHQNHLIRWRAGERVLAKFVLYFLMSPDGRKQIVDVASSTTGLHTLSVSKVSALKLPVPTLVEQTEIVRRVETLFAFADRLEARLASANAATNRLTPSLLAKAFRGELVPQDPSDEPASELLKRLAEQREVLAKAPKTKRSVKAS